MKSFEFNIYRIDSLAQAADFDLGDLEFIVGDTIISSQGQPRFSNMIYISISDLIEGILKINNGRKVFKFFAADSSFYIEFQKTEHGLYLRHQKALYGPVLYKDFLIAVKSGVSRFLQNSVNLPPTTGSVGRDLDQSRRALSTAIG